MVTLIVFQFINIFPFMSELSLNAPIGMLLLCYFRIKIFHEYGKESNSEPVYKSTNAEERAACNFENYP